MMRQRIFVPNFVIFFGCKCLFRMWVGDAAELRIIFFSVEKGAFSVYFFYKHRSVSFAQIRAKCEALMFKQSNVVGLAYAMPDDVSSHSAAASFGMHRHYS